MRLLITTPLHLLLVDADTGTIDEVRSGDGEYFGLSWSSEAIFVSHSRVSNEELLTHEAFVAAERGEVASYGRDGELKARTPKRMLLPHQIEWVDDRLLVVDTGRERISAYAEDGHLIRDVALGDVGWDRGADDRMGHHFNGVHRSGERVWVVAHNHDRPSELWELSWPALELVEVHVTGAEWAHNLWEGSAGPVVCDSRNGKLHDVRSGETIWAAGEPGVISRGLAVSEDHLFVGRSEPSTRHGRLFNDGGLWVVDRETLQTVEELRFAGLGCVNEVRLLDGVDETHNGEPFHDGMLDALFNVARRSDRVRGPSSRFRRRPAMSEPRPRVLFANHNASSASGGGGQVLHQTAAGLRRLGVTVEVTTDLHPDVRGFDLVHAFNVWPLETALPQMRHLGAADVPVVWEPIFSDLREFTWVLRAIRLLVELIPDSEDWRSVLAAIEAGTLVVDGLAQWGPNEVVPGYQAAVAEMLAIADHVSVCSLHEIGMLVRAAPTVRTPFTVVAHGVAAHDFADADPQTFVDRYGVADFILCVGSVEPRKNQLLLIEAIRDLGRPIVLIGPTHAGHGDYLAKCCFRGGDALTYIEELPRELVACAYKAAAVHALPSFAEGSALSTMEAAAAGCEIVTSNRGSELEYYGDLVRTCDPLSPSSIRAAVEHALRHRHGERLAVHMRRFSWERTAEATLAAYRRTLHPAPRSAR